MPRADVHRLVGTAAQKNKACSLPCSSALVFGDCKSVCQECIGVNAVAQGCCQLLGTAARNNKAGSLP